MAKALDEFFPKALALGMSREQYWDGDPMDVAAYREADRLRADRENRVAWLNGLYVYQALGAMAPLLNAFSKRSQAREYPEPVILDERERAEMKRRDLKGHMLNLMRARAERARSDG